MAERAQSSVPDATGPDGDRRGPGRDCCWVRESGGGGVKGWRGEGVGVLSQASLTPRGRGGEGARVISQASRTPRG